MHDRVVLSDLRFRGTHGVGDEERARPQGFAVTIECPTDAARAARSDDIAGTLDYRRLRAVAAEVIAGPPRHLLETLAEEIAHRILGEVGPTWVRVRVTKVAPPGFEGPATVEVYRARARAASAPVELHVPDFAPVRSFYGRLGFVAVREDPGPDGYLVLEYERSAIAFWPGSEAVHRHPFFARHPVDAPRGVGVEVIVATSELDTLYERARALDAVVEPIRLRPWGVRDFRIADPFGYYLRITEQADP